MSISAPAKQLARVSRGLLVCVLVAVVAISINHVVPTVSPLIIALVVGAIWTNVGTVPALLQPGVQFSAKRLLRSGIVLLGLQIAVADILGLGFGLIAVILVGTLGTFFFILYAGRRLGVSTDQRLLIAAGSSICGAAAVAGVDAAVNSKESEVLNAVAVITIFGSFSIGVVPLLSSWMGLSPTVSGAWAGASIHEVGQVIAAAGTLGGAALSAAAVVKLTRVLLLAPIVAGVSISRRRQGIAVGSKHPPLMPLFVGGFILAVALRSTGMLPTDALAVGKFASTALLTAAMFALGTGVNFKGLVRSSGRILALGAMATVFISVVTLVGVLTVS